jgi:DNA-binding transcriptional regulator LsrR (DeoR family)
MGDTDDSGGRTSLPIHAEGILGGEKFTEKKSADRLREQVAETVGGIIGHLRSKKWTEATGRALAEKLGITGPALSDFIRGRRLPKFEIRWAMAHYWDVPIWTLFPGKEHVFLHGEGAVRWLVRLGLGSPLLLACRNATDATLKGEPPAAVAALIAGEKADPAALRHAEQRIPEMVRAALERNVIELVTPDLDAVQDPELSADLTAGLSRLAGRPVAAHVVRNVAHSEFAPDPIAPYLIARVAHRVVERCLEDHHPANATIGIAGGIHVAAFVESVGVTTSPFGSGGDRHITLLPMTLEPFHEHRFELSDALAGALHRRAVSLLGEARVQAPSLATFGYLEHGRIGTLDTAAIRLVREQFLNLDVAIVGCGDPSNQGRIGRIERTLSLRLVPRPLTDVCMHFIGADGEPIPYPGGLEPLGVPIDELRRLAAQANRLALLLASGASKGLPITLVVRAGCANAVVCDAAAGRAALAAIAGM